MNQSIEEAKKISQIKEEKTIDELLKEIEGIPLAFATEGDGEWVVRTIPYAKGEGKTPRLALLALIEKLSNNQ